MMDQVAMIRGEEKKMKMKMSFVRIGFISSAIALFGVMTMLQYARAEQATAEIAAKSAEPPAGMVLPQYTDDGKLKVSENYRDWVFVGTSIGLSYNENVQVEADKAAESAAAEGVNPESPHYNPGVFHHTYMQPQAYAHYRKTGEFPEKTILVLEIYESLQKVQPDTKGFTQGKRLALEVSVKNHERIPEGWAYYDFRLKENKPAESARNFPKGMCYNCHEQHAREDKVFTQFYPILQEARALREAEQAAAPAQQ